MFDAEQPGWEIVRRIPIMGPEEHGGHCEIRFDGLKISDECRLMKVGDGLKVTQIRLGTARLTHCMRWLGMAKRAIEECMGYVQERQVFGSKLADHEGVQWLLGEAVMQIEVGRLLTMRAAAKLDAGDKSAAIQTLASRPSYGNELTAAIESGAVPRRDVPAVSYTHLTLPTSDLV